MRAWTAMGAALLCGLSFAAARVGAPQEPDAGTLPAGFDPAMMTEMMRLGQPGPEHEELAKAAGEWESTLTMRMMPDTDPMVESVSATAEMILGGRFLEIVSTGKMMGQDSEHRTIMGFDRRHEDYTMIGLDTTGTYWVTARGVRDDDGVIRMHGEDDDPMGKQVYTFEYEVISEDEHEFRVLFSQIGPMVFDEPFCMVTVHSTRK